MRNRIIATLTASRAAISSSVHRPRAAASAACSVTRRQPESRAASSSISVFHSRQPRSSSAGVGGWCSSPWLISWAMLLCCRPRLWQNEVNLTPVVDPLGGSYYVEALTTEVHDRAWEFFEQIMERGGFLACLDNGWLHGRALENQTAQLAAIETGDRKVVGVNFGQGDVGEFEIDGFQGTSDAWERGMERLRELRRTRDSRAHAAAMRSLEEACGGTANVLPPMVDAVAAGATVGEIGDVFRQVFGDWDAPIEF
jgi:methylmalonyl-CoA mutase N-terminal domain/subunit